MLNNKNEKIKNSLISIGVLLKRFKYPPIPPDSVAIEFISDILSLIALDGVMSIELKDIMKLKIEE